MTGGAALAASLAVPGIGWATPRPVELDLVGRTPAAREAGAEIAAHDPRTQRLYVTNAGANALDIYDARRPDRDPVRIDLSPYGGGPNSVDASEKHGGIVATSFRTYPSFPQRYIERLEQQMPCEADTDGVNVEPLRAPQTPVTVAGV